MDVIGERTGHVFCRSVENGGSGDPSAHTALGVFHGIRASLRHAVRRRTSSAPARCSCRAPARSADSSPRCSSRRARPCSSATSTTARARETGATVVAPDDALTTDCDVYAPCALGATLTARVDPAASLPRSWPAPRTTSSRRPRTVTGSARRASSTRPTTSSTAAARSTATGSSSSPGLPEQLDAEVERIGDTLLEIYAAADAEGITTAAAAERLAAERLSRPAASRTTP